MSIRPDSAHPRGGYARITLDAGAVDGTEVSLTIRNSFNDKYLGTDGWQAGRAYFGPYRVDVSGEQAEFVVGTEIVNLVEEYTPLSIGLGEKEFEVSWPDDIKHGPPAATIGGVSPTPPKPSGDNGPVLVGKAPEVKPEPRPKKETETEGKTEGTGADGVDFAPGPGSQKTDDHTVARPRKNTGLIIAGAAMFAAVVAGGTYWYLSQPDPVVPVEISGGSVVEPPPPPPDPCSEAGLAAAGANGYEAVLEQLSSCGGAVSPDTALGLIETGVDANDPAALAALGRLYDDAAVIEGVETEMGLTFSDNPARAAEYYSRAIEAGDGSGAAEALAGVCERLNQSNDTLSESAREDFCAK